jgi:sarcosine oxidase subunit beta
MDQVRLAWGYAFAASARGATFCFGQRVTALAGDGRVRSVETHDATIFAPDVVLATGPFLGRTAALAGIDLDIRPTRRHRLVIPDVPEVPPDAPMTIDDGSAAHWRPALGGAFVLWTDPETTPSEPSWNVAPAGDFAFRVLDPASPQAVARLAPFWADVWERPQRWYVQAGQYEYTPDHRPLVGSAASLGPEGVWINGGYSGHGVMASAGGARLLVDLLTGTEAAVSAGTNPFRPDRPFAEARADVL